MTNEKATDQFVRDLLRGVGVSRPWEQDGGPAWKRQALKNGSKSASAAGEGKPEFVFQSDGFVVVVEDKKDVAFTRHQVDGEITTEFPYRQQYALNGSVHYAKTMISNGIPSNKGIFAVGIGGDETHHEIAVVYVSNGIVKPLDDLDNLDVFAVDQIEEYYRVQVRGLRPRSEARLDDVRQAAAKLHEGMRNYGSVENDRKAPLVSAILLALRNQYFSIDKLDGLTPGNNNQVWDGRIIYDNAKAYMDAEALMPQQKIGTLLDQFAFIKNSPALNRRHRDLGESPLKWMAKILESQVLHVVTDPTMTAFDVLGNFYHEFISYGGGDGSGLGIVLTPEHITTLMAELIDVSASDYVLDPTAGTASFLIAAMQRMFADAGDDVNLQNMIREQKLHGIELQDKLFAIGTTNMILRGDGKANFRRDSIFEAPMAEMRGDKVLSDGSVIPGHGFTKVLLNPPYGQSKTPLTRNLSELAFIERALEFLNPGGRLAAIVPQSAMVGKTKEDRARKKALMKHNTLDCVITMNPQTFVNSGHSPHTVIVMFTAGRPHPADAKVKFINFEKDGFVVAAHRGLVDDGTAESRRKHLMEVLRGDAQDDSRFIVRSEATPEDEWQHSYFYFNDQPPTEAEFLSRSADYMTWLVDMHTHGFGSLVTLEADDSDRSAQDPVVPVGLDALEFSPMLIDDVFDSVSASSAWYDKSKLTTSGEVLYPFVSRTKSRNGVDGFCTKQSKEPVKGNVITIGLDTQTLGYQPVPFYTGQNIQVLRHPELDRKSAMVLMTLVGSQLGKFSWGGNGATLGRLKKTNMMVPVIRDEDGATVVDWKGIAGYGLHLSQKIAQRMGAVTVDE